MMDTWIGWYLLPVWVINLLLDLETDSSFGNQFDGIVWTQNQSNDCRMVLINVATSDLKAKTMYADTTT